MSLDIGTIILVIGILIAAFLFGVLYLLGSAFGIVIQGIERLFGWSGSGRLRGGTSVRLTGRRTKVCPNQRCRKAESRNARYCSQCGGPMGPAFADRHGIKAGARA